jgi:hypothetical protein
LVQNGDFVIAEKFATQLTEEYLAVKSFMALTLAKASRKIGLLPAWLYSQHHLQISLSG